MGDEAYSLYTVSFNAERVFFFAKHYGIKHLDGLNLQIHWIKIALCNLMM